MAHAALPDERLNCVLLPILARDVGKSLETIFELWSDKRFFPMVRDSGHKPHLLVVLNCASDELCAAVSQTFTRYPNLGRCFSGFSVRSAELTGDRDLYVRGESTAKGLYGNKAGPNFLFQAGMKYASVFGGFTIQLELDCLPIEAGWLEDVMEVVSGNARAWVIGSHFAGLRGIERSSQSHLNGNACYKAGDRKFIAFLDEIWIPDVVAQSERRPNLAYDCWWASEEFQANGLSGNTAWRRVQTFGSFFHPDPFIINLLVDDSRLADYADVYKKFVDLGRRPIFCHGPAMNGFAGFLLKHPDQSFFQALHEIAPVAGEFARNFVGRVAERRLKEDDKGKGGENLAVLAPPKLAEIDRRNRGAGARTREYYYLLLLAGELLLKRPISGMGLAADFVEKGDVKRARDLLGESSEIVKHFNDVVSLSNTRHQSGEIGR